MKRTLLLGCLVALSCSNGRGNPSASCTTNPECDDGITCTIDTCQVGGQCGHMTLDALCPSGEACVEGVGCTRVCTTDAECDDAIACTIDVCAVGGMCQRTPRDALCPPGLTCVATSGCLRTICATDADCQDANFCNGAEVCTETGCQAATAPRNCDDGEPCTDDACDPGLDMCVNTRLGTPGCELPFDPTRDYSGCFDIAPAPIQRCAPSFGGRYYVDYDIRSLCFSLLGMSALNATVTTAHFPSLSQPSAPPGPDFAVFHVISGGCEERYEIAGSFTGPDRFTAVWSATFTDFDGLSCSLSGCVNQSVSIAGTRR